MTIFIFYVFLKKYDLCHYKVDKKVTDNDNPVYKKQNKMENIWFIWSFIEKNVQLYNSLVRELLCLGPEGQPNHNH